MSLIRKNFKPAEKEELLNSGTAVEWLHGSHWLPGEVVGEGHDTLGLHYAVVVNLKRTPTVSYGDHVRGYPGHLRLARED